MSNQCETPIKDSDTKKKDLVYNFIASIAKLPILHRNCISRQVLLSMLQLNNCVLENPIPSKTGAFKGDEKIYTDRAKIISHSSCRVLDDLYHNSCTGEKKLLISFKSTKYPSELSSTMKNFLKLLHEIFNGMFLS